MQRIVCCFLFVFKNACVSSSVKNSLTLLVSPASHTARLLGETLARCPAPAARRPAVRFVQPCADAVLSGLPSVKGVNLFSVCTLIRLCLCSIHTSEQPFLDSVSPPSKRVSSAVTVASLLLKMYLQMYSQILFS